MIDVVAVMSVVLTTVTVWRAAVLWQRIGELKPRGRQETGRYSTVVSNCQDSSELSGRTNR